MGLRDQNNAKKIGINGSRIYHVTTLLFADDTNLFMSHKNLNALIVQMNRELTVEGE